jgi:hypothetical protein
VKICSLYGVGFYYIPGTDMCLKIGGWMRTQYDYGMNGNSTSGYFTGNVNNRTTNLGDWRFRGYITADARNQTPYGTVRAYIDVGFNENITGGGGVLASNSNRAFIQWAGFTFGEAVSFFDFYALAAYQYLPSVPASTTGGGGWGVAAYTAQFGNGFSGTISAEMRRQTQIISDGTSTGTNGILTPGAIAAGGYGGFQAPDVVGNLRVDQAWGSAQIMAAWHQVNSLYYGVSAGNGGIGSGHPSDESGWAVGGGIKLNTPMIGKGDNFMAQIDYAQGASGYVFSPQISAFNWYARSGADAGYGIMTDAVYGGTIGAGNASSLQLTTAWGVNAAYEHHWNDQWHTSVYGGYAEMNYNRLGNALLCVFEGGGNGAGVGTGAVATAGCNNDWNVWWLGSRTQWDVTKDFNLGIDVMYSSLQSASAVGNLLPASQQSVATGSPTALNISDEGAWSFEIRAHKDFYP